MGSQWWAHSVHSGRLTPGCSHPRQVTQLREEHHVYMTKDGRISMAGINSSNVQCVAPKPHSMCTHICYVYDDLLLPLFNIYAQHVSTCSAPPASHFYLNTVPSGTLQALSTQSQLQVPVKARPTASRANDFGGGEQVVVSCASGIPAGICLQHPQSIGACACGACGACGARGAVPTDLVHRSPQAYYRTPRAALGMGGSSK